MALLQKIKEKLGFGSGPTEREKTDPEVTVERESEPEPESTDEPDESTEDEESAGDDPVAAETEAAASTDSLVDEEGATEDPSEAAEPAEAAGIADEEISVDDETGVDVEELKGIGPAYAERLAEIGIETVDDLSAADAEAVAEGASVGEKRAATWIKRAKEF